MFLQNLVHENKEEFRNAAVDEVVGFRERNTAITGDQPTELISRRNSIINVITLICENLGF
jgi:hypothetical protein